MPAPLAKGIIVTVSVLVAAGIAVYESPQFQQWFNNSRRKIALALHHLGDEIQPRGSASPVREDISMTEETGEAADERRRIARAEIMRRAAILESRRGMRESQQPLESFDFLVDQDGKLRTTVDTGKQLHTEDAANSTAIDGGSSQPVWRGSRQNETDRGGLHLDIPADAASHHPSESVLEFTPTSEAPAAGSPFDPFSDTPKTPQSPVSASASSHTEDHSEIYYAHPASAANAGNQQGLLLADLNELSHGGFQQHAVSAAPSTAGSFSHIGKLTDASSDGTMSDLGERSVGGVATPASWSEVGSVISSDDAGHHPLL